MRRKPVVLVAALTAAAVFPASLFAWGSAIHSGIIQAALMAIPAGDRIQERWGDEAWRLREYVQMADWINTLVSQRELWDAGGQTLEQAGIQFFANDYLLFPSAPRAFQHSVPAVQATYRPYFIRALQALRTESPANAARWTGSLLHFVTDSGSPPHAIGVSGDEHTKMENWLDPSKIDLTGYRAQLLGNTDEAALKGLIARMDRLIAFSAVRARQMLPLVKMNDRARMEPLALESAAETARVSADVIHTLLALTGSGGNSETASILAEISAPALDGLPNLPAKLMLMGSDISTMSDQSLPSFQAYRGQFRLRAIPPGTYRLAVERVGSRTLYLPPIALKANEIFRAAWNLAPDHVSGNLAPNPDLTLHWLTPGAPDHWRFDAPQSEWVSDNIPVTAGKSYLAGYELHGEAPVEVEIQWMSHAWEAMKGAPERFDAAVSGRREKPLVAPAGAVFVRFLMKGREDPSTLLDGVFIKAQRLLQLR